jgi:hypothetical protein
MYDQNGHRFTIFVRKTLVVKVHDDFCTPGLLKKLPDNSKETA